MTLEKFIILNAKYEKLSGPCKLLLSQLSKFESSTALAGFQDVEIECAYGFLVALIYESQWGGELYKEIQELIHFLFSHLQRRDNHEK